MKKIALFLATKKGFSVLDSLCQSEYIKYIFCVISFHEVGVQKDWSEDLKYLCNKYKIKFYFWKEIKDNLGGFIKNNLITSVIAISWRFLLPIEINNDLEDNIIVFHDSLLPKYRGFAPVVTAILNNDNFIGATALFASNSVDAGNIILQKKIIIQSNEYISNVIERISELYVDMCFEIMDKILGNSLSSVQQNELEATYSIWRDEEDYEIDWSKTNLDIYNQIRATGYPYKGSFTYIDGDVVRILSAEIEPDIQFAIRDPGKIWSLNGGIPSVICGKGLLKITKAIYDSGELYIFKKLRVRLGKVRYIMNKNN